MKTHIQVLASRACLLGCGSALAWGAVGHQTVGAIADSLLVGTNAGHEVKMILGTEKLKTAALWPDCARGVIEKAPFDYVVNPKYKECAPFESPAGQQEMSDFVKRNLDACHAAPDEESCHRGCRCRT